MDDKLKNNIEEKISADTLSLKIIDNFPDFEIEDYNRADYLYDTEPNILDSALDEMNRIKINIAYRPIVSNRKFISPLIIAYKKVIRRVMLKWYVEPVCFQQSDFNQAVVRGMEALRKINVSGHEKVEENARIQEENKKEIAFLHKLLKYATAEMENTCNKIDIFQQFNSATKLERLGEKINSISTQLNSLQQVQSEYVSKTVNYDTSMERILTLENLMRDTNRKIESAEKILDKFRTSGIELQWNNDDSYTSSQAGEDVIIRYLLGGMGIPYNECSYIDLGANHAIQLSNTYWLYRQGARGVLVEANPSLIPELRLCRAQDIILQRCVATKNGEWVEFYPFEEDGLSTTCKEQVDHCLEVNSTLHLQNTFKVQTITVEEIIKNVLKQTPILLNIDIEGNELQILQTINFSEYRPAIIIVETIPYNKILATNCKSLDIVDFMHSQEYEEYAFTGINSIFIDLKRLPMAEGKKSVV